MLETTVFNSGEVQTSVTMLSGLSLPIWPAGMVRVVYASDCPENTAEKCGNKGYPVITERYVLGNRALRSSSFGTPASLDPQSGKVRDWINDPSARAANFASNLKPGEVTYAAECYLNSPESPSGVYSRTMF